MNSSPDSIYEEKDNPFDDFFVDPVYLKFKKLFWNYQVRLRAIRKELEQCAARSILEVGAGIAPIVPETSEVIYTDLSQAAVSWLKKKFPQRQSVVAAAGQLPFQNEQFDTVVSSEVLEHIPDDRSALGEIFRVLKPKGALIITVPAHAYFFGLDDRFVRHERRYNPARLTAQLGEAGFDDIHIYKIAGILDKAALMTAVLVFKLFSGKTTLDENKKTKHSHRFLKIVLPLYGLINMVFGFLVRMEAKIIPLFLTTVIMVRAQKKKGEGLCQA